MTKSQYLNYLRAAKWRIKHFLKKQGIVTNKHGVKDKQLIKKFAEIHNITINSRINNWLIELYLSGVNESCKQADYGFYLSRDWLFLRKKILLKYGYICMKCGSTQRIAVDHIKPRSKFPELELCEENLQVLCLSCNSKKGNKKAIDYRIK